MKFFLAMLATETNTFSPFPTALQDFSITRPGEERGDFALPQGLFDHLQDRDVDVIEGTSAFAQPLGITTRAAYETLICEILEQLQAALPVDVVQLMLHGAMVAEGIDDAEVDILRRVRELVGPEVKIGCELDLHCHIDQRMLDVADAIVIYKEYPHVDVLERAIELADILHDLAMGKVQVTMALFDCKVHGLCSTFREPMRQFVDDMIAAEKADGVLSLSLAHGFPYGDVAHAGAKMLAITDGDPAQAMTLAEAFGRRFTILRKQVLMQGLGLDEAMSLAVASDKRPTVVADQADNAGGGAPADSTFALRWLLEHRVEKAGVAILYDPEVVKIAAAAGEGASLSIRLGGKTGPSSGDPLDVTATVLRLIDGYQHEFPQAEGQAAIPIALGHTACLKVDGVHVIVSSRRSQCFTPKIWEDFGVPIASLDIIVPKSTNHFMAAHGPIAGEVIYMSGEGALAGDLCKVPYKNMPTADKYPWVENPLDQ